MKILIWFQRALTFPMSVLYCPLKIPVEPVEGFVRISFRRKIKWVSDIPNMIRKRESFFVTGIGKRTRCYYDEN